MRSFAAARTGRPADDGGGGLRPLRAEGARQVRRHAEAVFMWGGVRMGADGRGGEVRRRPGGIRVAHVPLFILVWIARSLLQDSIVLYVVALVAALYWLRVCETLLVRLGLLRMKGVDVA